MRSTTSPGPRDEAVYTFRIERAKLDRLREIAEAEHRSVVQELRRMVDERIAVADRDEPIAA